MIFKLSVWNKYRHEAAILGEHIQSFKDGFKLINLDKDILQGYIAHITCILKESSTYMEKCGLTIPPPLWKYNVKDPTTHPSSSKFLYKKCMSEQEIRNYGNEFMVN